MLHTEHRSEANMQIITVMLRFLTEDPAVRKHSSVDGEDVALDLVAQLGLQVAQLLLEDGER